MVLEALAQYVKADNYKMEKINVGGQEFKVHPDVKIFIGGKAVKAGEVQNNLKSFSPKDILTLQKQLSLIQKYSGVYGGARDTVDPTDFERCDKKQAKKDGISYEYLGEDDVTGKFGCADGRFELVW